MVAGKATDPDLRAAIAELREAAQALRDATAAIARQPDPLRLYRLRHWARVLGVSLKTLKAAVSVGHLTAVQTGRGANSPLRCHRGHVDAWLESRKFEGRKVW